MCIGDNLNNDSIDDENNNEINQEDKDKTLETLENGKNPNTIFKEQNSKNKDFIEIMFYIMVFLLIAQLIAINSDWNIAIILMNISILGFVLLKYVFSNKGSKVFNTGISWNVKNVEHVSVMEIFIACSLSIYLIYNLFKKK